MKTDPTHMEPRQPSDSDEPDPKRVPNSIEEAGKLLEAANVAAGAVGALHVTFLTVMAYIAITIFSTTDEALFRESRVTLPLLNAQISISYFYVLAPWLVVGMHLYLVVKFDLLARKLQHLEMKVKDLVPQQRQDFRNRLINVHAYLIAEYGQKGFLEWLFKAVTLLNLAVLPLVLLLWSQFTFLPYHSDRITLLQQLAITAEVCPLLVLAHILARARGGDRRGLAASLRERVRDRLVALSVYMVGIVLSWFVLTIPGPRHPWEQQPWTLLPATWMESDRPLRRFLEWSFARKNIDLLDVVLTANSPDPEVVQALRLGDPGEKRKALDKVIGLSLQDRDLRYANLIGVVLPKADLRHAGRFQYVNLSWAKLQDASLDQANLTGADLVSAQLQGANLSDVRLLGANLSDAQLQGARLIKAQLQGADLRRAQLQGADLSEASLQGARLMGANLQGAYLAGVNLKGADLTKAKLQGADFFAASIGSARFEGADLTSAHLRSINREPMTIDERRALGQQLSQVMSREVAERIMDEALPPVGRDDTLDKAAPGLWLCEDNRLSSDAKRCGTRPEHKVDFVQQRTEFLTWLACSDPFIGEGIISRAISQADPDGEGDELARFLLENIHRPGCTSREQLSGSTRSRLNEILFRLGLLQVSREQPRLD